MYGEIPPPRSLARLVDCFWAMRSEGPLPERHTTLVLPDGCSDLIFNLGDPPGLELHDRRQLRAYVVGTMTRALHVPLIGRVDLFGVRFRPGAGLPFLGVPAEHVTDRAVDLFDVWPDQRFLAEQLSEIEIAERAGLVTRALEARSGSHTGGPDPRVEAACQLIAVHGGSVLVDDLARAAGVGRRQLERLFMRDVGTSPKFASRVARLTRALGLVRDQYTLALARVAFEVGYADQAHMTRECAVLAGTTPADYRERTR